MQFIYRNQNIENKDPQFRESNEQFMPSMEIAKTEAKLSNPSLEAANDNQELRNSIESDTYSGNERADIRELEKQPEFMEAQSSLNEALDDPILGELYQDGILPRLLGAKVKIDKLVNSNKPDQEATALQIIAQEMARTDKELSKYPKISKEQKELLLALSTQVLDLPTLQEKINANSKADKVEFVAEMLPFFGSLVNFAKAGAGRDLAGRKLTLGDRAKEVGAGALFLLFDGLGVIAAAPSMGGSAAAAVGARSAGVAGKAALKSSAKTATKSVAKETAKGGLKKGGRGALKGLVKREALDPETVSKGLRLLEEMAKADDYTKLAKGFGKAAKGLEDYPKLAKAAEKGTRYLVEKRGDKQDARLNNAEKALKSTNKYAA